MPNIKIEHAALQKTVVYFYLRKEALIPGATLEGEIDHFYRGIFKMEKRENYVMYPVFYEYPYVYFGALENMTTRLNNDWHQVGCPVFNHNEVQFFTEPKEVVEYFNNLKKI